MGELTVTIVDELSLLKILTSSVLTFTTLTGSMGGATGTTVTASFDGDFPCLLSFLGLTTLLYI